MKVALLTTLGLGLASAAPAALSQEKQETSLDKRQGPLALAIIGGVASAVASKVIGKFTGSKRSTQAWDEYRVNLLPELIAAMDDESQSDEATVCARQGEYNVSDWFKVVDRATIAADMGGATDLIDCFFITGPSTVTFTQPANSTDVQVEAGPCTYSNSTLTCS